MSGIGLQHNPLKLHEDKEAGPGLLGLKIYRLYHDLNLVLVTIILNLNIFFLFSREGATSNNINQSQSSSSS